MAAFEYQALDTRGKNRKGILSADTARQARDKLRESGLTPLNLKAVTDDNAGKQTSVYRAGGKGSNRHRMNTTEFAVFIRQLATLLGSGLTVEDSLNGLIKQAETMKTQAVITGIRSAVMEGRSLADAMALFPRSFNEL